MYTYIRWSDVTVICGHDIIAILWLWHGIMCGVGGGGRYVTSFRQNQIIRFQKMYTFHSHAYPHSCHRAGTDSLSVPCSTWHLLRLTHRGAAQDGGGVGRLTCEAWEELSWGCHWAETSWLSVSLRTSRRRPQSGRRCAPGTVPAPPSLPAHKLDVTESLSATRPLLTTTSTSILRP